jgi:hypothetical protein
MKEYVKAKVDQQVEKRDMEQHPVLKYLKQTDRFKFKIGDILVLENRYDGKWEPEKASCGVACKYLYAWENELGIGYVRRISIDGNRYTGQPQCILNFDPDHCRFQLAPEVMEHMLLGEEGDDVDIKSQYAEIRRKRERVNRHNQKLQEDTKTEANVLVMLTKLKPGDRFWAQQWRGYDLHKNGYEVISITIDKNNLGYSLLEFRDFGNASAYKNRWYVNTMVGRKLYLTEPMFKDEDGAIT